jgi:hypothetical protein
VDGERRRSSFRSFLLGGLVGGAAGVAAAGRMRMRERTRRRVTPAGLAAFEQAPCYEEVVAAERRERGGG